MVEPEQWIKPGIVVEVGHEGITKSRKYSSGYNLRFPRFVRIREDKDASEVDSIH
jgi:DNA ligase-1